MTELDFTGQNILVIGGSSGIGNGIAQAFRRPGANIHVWGTRTTAQDYAGDDGSDLEGLGYTQVDVATPAAIEAAPLPFDRLDVLVHSQGTVRYRRQEFQPEGWDTVMAVNVDSILHASTKLHAALAAAKGCVIVISSIGGYRGQVGNPAYAASKAGAISLVKSLAQAWAGDGIRVNGIAPGLVDTKLTKVTMDHDERRTRALAKIPLDRFGTPADMAGVALFLASPLAGYVDGQTIIVDGGLSL